MKRFKVPSAFVRAGIRAVCRAAGPHVPFPAQRRGLELVLNVRPLPPGTSVRRTVLGGVPAEVVTGPGGDGGTTVVHFHGGGYCVGSPSVGRQWAAHLAARARCRVILPDYRLAPEHPFPVPLDDARAALDAVLAGAAGPVIVSGDSAGGGLALNLAAEQGPGLAGCVLLSPWLDLSDDRTGDAGLARRDVMLSPERIETFAAGYVPAGEDRARPEVSPLYRNLKGLPRLLLQYGTEDLLAPDSVRLAVAVRDAGGEIVHAPYPGMWHDFVLLAGLIPDADPAVDQAAAFVTAAREAVAV